jgi:hypothetical protein
MSHFQATLEIAALTVVGLWEFRLAIQPMSKLGQLALLVEAFGGMEVLQVTEQICLSLLATRTILVVSGWEVRP